MLGILATHPIQYQVPWFLALARRPDLSVKVYYASLPDERQQGVGFGVPFRWDIPMLEGYPWEPLDARPALLGAGGFFRSRAGGLGRRLRADRVDALLLTGWGTASLLWGLVEARRHGIPALIRGDSNIMRRRQPMVKLAHRSLFRRYDAFLVVGRANAELYRRSGVPDNLLFPCPHFVDNRRFSEQAAVEVRRRMELRALWAIAEDATCFLFAGKLQPRKRMLDLVSALGRVVRTAKVHLLVVGAGEQLEEGRMRAAELGVPATFAGFLNQTEITRAYVASDCLVLPSGSSETWGLVVNEAMASGRCAIISDQVGCGPDLIVDGETGFTYPVGDVGALAARLEWMATRPEDRARLARNARRLIEGFSVERAVEGTVAGLQHVLKGRRGVRSGAARP